MQIHEYQAKEILKKAGLPTLPSFVIENTKDINAKLKNFSFDSAVVKAQIHSGARGKAGGVKFAKSSEEIKKTSEEILGKTLITHQTGPEGKKVHQLLIEAPCDIKKEFYLAFLIDRKTQKVCLIFSKEGGIDIEELAEKFPEKIYKKEIDPYLGLTGAFVRSFFYKNDLEFSLFSEFYKVLSGLYSVFLKKDCSLLEVNPLVLTSKKEIKILDCKMAFDSNALFRQKQLLELRDKREENLLEQKAVDEDLSFVKLEGNIACMVNGAGLAMATMDIIKLYGGDPANFLDVGGGASREKIKKAFEIILSDKNVKGILVNIFGGIMRCDLIAETLISVLKDLKLKVPLVIRLEGTKSQEAKEILKKERLNFTSASSLSEAAEKIVEQVKCRS